jgi:hypothetical protein
MSALGQKQTFAVHQPMSALPPKADIVQHGGNVRLGIMSFEAPPGKRSMFGYLTIDLLNSVSGMSISERLQPQPYTCKWLVAFIASPLTSGLLGQE